MTTDSPDFSGEFSAFFRDKYEKIENVFRYLHYTFGLLKLNIGTLLVFELLYKFASMAVFKPLLTGVMKLALKAQG